MGHRKHTAPTLDMAFLKAVAHYAPSTLLLSMPTCLCTAYSLLHSCTGTVAAVGCAICSVVGMQQRALCMYAEAGQQPELLADQQDTAGAPNAGISDGRPAGAPPATPSPPPPAQTGGQGIGLDPVFQVWSHLWNVDLTGEEDLYYNTSQV